MVTNGYRDKRGVNHLTDKIYHNENVCFRVLFSKIPCISYSFILSVEPCVPNIHKIQLDYRKNK